MALTKVSGGILDPGIDVAGIVTATGFHGPIIAGVGNSNITAGIITATELDLNGNVDISGNLTVHGDQTTLNTTLRQVELLRVNASDNTVTAGIVTQTGTGDILNLFDGTTEVFTVIDGGNVGIGTDTPMAHIHSVGVANTVGILSSTNNGANFDIFDDDTQTRIRTVDGRLHLGADHLDAKDNSEIRFLVDNDVKAYITGFGSFGLGTVPETFFHIQGDKPKLRIESTNSLEASVGREEIGRIEFEAKKVNNYNVAASIRVRQDGTWSTVDDWFSPTAIEFYTQDQSGTEITEPRLVINRDGEVSIGRTTALLDSKLSITKVADQPGIGIQLNQSTGITTSLLVFNSSGTNIFDLAHSTDTTPDLIFKLKGSSDAAPEQKFLIQSDSKVLVGAALTDNVNGQFHIHQSSAGNVTAASDANTLVLESSASVGMSFLTANDSIARIKFGSPTASNSGVIAYNHDGDKMSLVTGTGTRMIIDSNMISARTHYGIKRDTGGYTFRETNEGSERAGMHSDSSNNLIFKVGAADEKLRIEAGTSTNAITVTGEIATSQDYPDFRPTVDFNFAAEKKLDPRITYDRTGSASFTDEFGKVVLVGGNVPRFDHDPITKECKGLLIEEERTNYVRQSLTLESEWVSGTGSFAVDNSITNPDGSVGAYYHTGGELYHQDIDLSAAGTNVITVSLWVKERSGQSGNLDIEIFQQISGTVISMGVWSFNPATEVISTVPATYSDGKVVKYPNGWYRVSAKATTASGNFSSTTRFDMQTAEHYVWGMQIEVGEFPTSFIPTRGAISTREHDNVRILGDDYIDIFGTRFENFSVVADFDNVTFNPNYTLQASILEWWGDSSGYNDRVQIMKDNASPYHIETRAFGIGSAIFSNGNLTASSLAATNRLATSWSVDYSTSNAANRRWAFSFSGEGVDVVGDATGTSVPALTKFGIGCSPRLLNLTRGVLLFKRLMIYDKTLSDNQLRTLSAR